MKRISILLLTGLLFQGAYAQTYRTYAQRLGYPKGARVLLLHMDDGGMSYDSNIGIEKVLQKGVAPSLSVMMPCPWAPQIVRYILSHPGTDAGLHLTLTSEWKNYRWGPLAGKSLVPGLTDPEGCFWPDASDVVKHSSSREVGLEIRAQLDRAETMGFHPTHLDTHMGVLFDKPSFLMQYIHLGIEKHIPIMLPGGKDTYIESQIHAPDSVIRKIQKLGKMIWAAGLPVLDDLHNTSYDWKIPAGMKRDDANLLRWREGMYEKTLLQLKPGLTMVIMHCTDPSSIFSHISNSGDIRKADMLVMLDPAFRKFLKDHGFILTTWRELARRRALVGKS
ncbi:MAG TPA: polysaccharide deacetylase family protein [Chitinophagaceae bacterium]|nr:polysaccharide deacetylase family protein [Chitinophagaceae bacterium]